MKLSLFALSLLLAVLLTQGCSESRHHDGKTQTSSSHSSSYSSSAESSSSQDSSSSESNITINPTIKSVKLSIPIKELPENNQTTVSVLVTYLDETNTTPKTGIVWHIGDTNIVEVNGTRLFARNEGHTTIQAEVGGVLSSARSIAVYKVVHGHRLPPEPDPAINNSTLLGIDVNNNGVRDDVERWIYTRYDTHLPCEMIPVTVVIPATGEEINGTKKVCGDTPVPYHQIVREIAMQFGRAAQIIIQEPEKARETMKYMDAAVDCNGYFRVLAKGYGEPILVDHYIFNDDYKDVQFNTSQRVRAFAEHNHALSGGVYSANETAMEDRAKCDFDVDRLLGK